MDSFRYILYVYKRTILRASGREKDKKTRCGSARRSNGTTGGSKTHEVRVRLGNIYGLAGVSSNNDLSGISVDGGKTYSGFKNFNGRQTVESAEEWMVRSLLCRSNSMRRSANFRLWTRTYRCISGGVRLKLFDARRRPKCRVGHLMICWWLRFGHI